MNSRPMILRLRSGLATPLSFVRKRFDGVDEDDLEVQPLGEALADLQGLVLAQHAVVHEDAGQPVADRPVHQHRRHRGVHPARQGADHLPLRSHLLPDALGRLLHEGRGVPVPGAAARVEEVPEDRGPLLAVHDLGVEQHAVEPPLGVLDRRDRVRLGRPHDVEALGGLLHVVPVAHPHAGARAAGPGTASPPDFGRNSAWPYSRCPALFTTPPRTWLMSCIP